MKGEIGWNATAKMSFHCWLAMNLFSVVYFRYSGSRFNFSNLFSALSSGSVNLDFQVILGLIGPIALLVGSFVSIRENRRGLMVYPMFFFLLRL